MTSRVLASSTCGSFGLQCIAGVYGLLGLLQQVPRPAETLKLSLTIEMLVQVIQISFYVHFLSNFDLGTMALTRYKDWLLTTPLMLISAAIYYYYEGRRAEARKDGGGAPSHVLLKDFWRDHARTLLVILGANFVMLGFGYAGEAGWLPRAVGVAGGFAAFALCFYAVWSELAAKSSPGRRLFVLNAATWALYGVVYLIGDAAMKNVAFNGLDLVAKNLFGVYLTYKVLTARMEHEPDAGFNDET